MYAPIWKFIGLFHCTFDILDQNHEFSGPVARQPMLSWLPFCATIFGVVLMSAR